MSIESPSTFCSYSHLIVGAGAAGTLTAVRVILACAANGSDPRVLLVDSRPAGQMGIAYSTTDRAHLLNVRASEMSAFPEVPDHLVRWLDEHAPELADPAGFVPRTVYRRYLDAVLTEAAGACPEGSLTRLRDRAMVLAPAHDREDAAPPRWQLKLTSGRVVRARHVVLALGHLGVSTAWCPPGLLASGRFVRDPWQTGALSSVPAGDVLIVGTGLTMVDVLLSLRRPGRVIHAVSRHGAFPRAHTSDQPPAMGQPGGLDRDDVGLDALRRAVSDHVRQALRRHRDWRPAIDSLRPITQTLWQKLTPAERVEFVSRDARLWEVARHRVPPASAAVLDHDRRSGRLVAHRGTVASCLESPDGLDVTLSDGHRLSVAAVVNCTGPTVDPAASDDPLVDSLTAAGHATRGPLGLGFATDDHGALVRADGNVSPGLWTLGSLRRGMLWESVAIPEIRVQAARLATCTTEPRRAVLTTADPHPAIEH